MPMAAEGTFGAHVRAVLERYELTIAQLAREYGRDASVVSRMLTRGKARTETMHEVAAALTRLVRAERGLVEMRWTAASLLESPEPAGVSLVPVSDDYVQVRYGGEVPCGEPLELVDDGDSIWVLASWLERGMDASNTVALRAVGTSLTGARVYPGDLVLVRTDIGSRDGDLVLVCTPAGCTLKRQRGEGLWGWLEAVSDDASDHEAATQLGDLGTAIIQGVVRVCIGRRDMEPPR